MLAPLLLLWPMSIAVTYLVAKSIANGPFDRALEADAYVIARQIQPVNGVAELRLPDATRDFLRADNVDSVFFQVLGTRGELVGGDRDMPLPHEDDRPQAGIVEFRDDVLRGNNIRVAYTTVDLPGLAPGRDPESTQPVLVQVAETLDKRSQLANDIIKGVILPQFVILPLAIILVWFGLSRGLAPLHALQSNIRAQRPDDLSPLAGLRMQAEFALRQDVSMDVQRSLEQIATSSEHAARLVTQLLALARAENRATGQIFSRIELTTLARSAVRDWVQAALAKGMDLGYEEPPYPIEVEGNVVMLREMLSNLIDNAIRYTPRGGRITVRVRTKEHDIDTVHLEVEDTGLGIPPAERERVVERFYRILGREGDGSGLGLAIVKEIVTMHGGALAIEDHVYQEAPRLAGTLVRVSLQRVYPSRDKP
ncbi:Signal transduction histidine kinase [Candidatus Burkholderia verschuerenii]|uniref:histidine kinase n=1 Tax=Candidatus Burkholderia verschuerenii TaxID=242163 RepID=A0A0L0MG28_9BURK|nr:Signal transduction histidine kinase [Candidatus Burkholderia verschuerenii]